MTRQTTAKTLAKEVETYTGKHGKNNETVLHTINLPDVDCKKGQRAIYCLLLRLDTASDPVDLSIIALVATRKFVSPLVTIVAEDTPRGAGKAKQMQSPNAWA